MIAPKTLKIARIWAKYGHYAQYRALKSQYMVVFFKNGNICLYNARVRTYTLFKPRKVRQNQYTSPKTVKNDEKMPKMLIQGLSGALSSGFF